MTVDVLPTAYGQPALDALSAVVTRLKRDDPMARVTVIAPNNLAGIVARRHLAAGTADRPGIAGIEITTLGRLSERTATPLLAPRRPATRTVVAAAWRRALATDPLGFHDIADHPATVRALAEAHTELRDLTPGALRAVKDATPVGRDLVSLHEAVTDALRADWFDRTDIVDAATAHLDPAQLGACILYLPQDLTRAEARFAAALAATTDLTVIAGLTGARRADAAIRRTLTLFGTDIDSEPTFRPGTATRIINASDSDDEVRCVVRDLMDTLTTHPAHRVAVLYSAVEPYARLLHEQLATAGVAVNGTGTRTADERAVARLLLEVLALADRDVPRADLFRALANAPVRDFDGGRIPLSRWERTSRKAGVVSGGDWTARIDAYITECRTNAAAERDDVDPRDWLIERHLRDADTAEDLGRFATRLRDELRRAASMTTWADLSDWCLELFTSLVGDVDTLTRMPIDEQYAATTLFSVLRSLAALDAVDSDPSLRTLRDVLDTELAAALPRVGRFGDGVLVAPISSAIGLDLDVVYLVGLSEDLFPGRLRADALLPDRARDATNGELPAHRERLYTKYRHLLAALACAGEAVASFPRGDLRRSSGRLPSRFLLPSLRGLSGDRALAATAWDRPETYGTGLVTAGSFAGELLHTDALATEQEWRIRQISAAGSLVDPVVEAAVPMLEARAGGAFTRYDGNLASVDGLPDYAVEERAISPTALESYATCPHAYFVNRLLGVEPLEQPEDVVEISPLTIGNLIHHSVDVLVREFGDDLPTLGQPWTSGQLERLVAIALATADSFQARGLTGHPRLWAPERDRILDNVAWLLADDNAWRAGLQAEVLASEMPFGMHGEPPVEVTIPSGRVRMRGSADKVDRGADGSLYVTDIKTGSARRFTGITQDDPLVGGTKLQLPVYAYAARQRFGLPDTPVRATYWFVRRDRGRRGIDLTPDVETRYAQTLDVIVRSIAGGLFPAKAPEAPDYATFTQCPYCNPDGVGHDGVRKRWERQRVDPALRDLVTLIEPTALAGVG